MQTSLDEQFLSLEPTQRERADWGPVEVVRFVLGRRELASQLEPSGVLQFPAGYVHPVLVPFCAAIMGCTSDQLRAILRGDASLTPQGVRSTDDGPSGVAAIRSALASAELDDEWRSALRHTEESLADILVFDEIIGPTPAFSAMRFLHDGESSMLSARPVHHPLRRAFERVEHRIGRYDRLVELGAPEIIVNREVASVHEALDKWFELVLLTRLEGLEPRTAWGRVRPLHEAVPIPTPDGDEDLPDDEAVPLDEMYAYPDEDDVHTEPPVRCAFLDDEHLLIQRNGWIECRNLADNSREPEEPMRTWLGLEGASPTGEILFMRDESLGVLSWPSGTWSDVVPPGLRGLQFWGDQSEDGTLWNVRGELHIDMNEVVQTADRPTLLGFSPDLAFAVLGASEYPVGILSVDSGLLHQEVPDLDDELDPTDLADESFEWEDCSMADVPVIDRSGRSSPARAYDWSTYEPVETDRCLVLREGHGFRLLTPRGFLYELEHGVPRRLAIFDLPWVTAAWNADGTRLVFVTEYEWVLFHGRTFELLASGKLSV